MRISDWSSDVCSSDLVPLRLVLAVRRVPPRLCLMLREVCSLGLPCAFASCRAAVKCRMRSSSRRTRCNPLKDEMLSSCGRSEKHTSELQSLMRISYAVFCLKKKTIILVTKDRKYIKINES